MISHISTVFSRAQRYHKQNVRLKLFQESSAGNYVHQILRNHKLYRVAPRANLVDHVILTLDWSHVLRRILYEPGQVNGGVGRVLQKSVVLWAREISFFPWSLWHSKFQACLAVVASNFLKCQAQVQLQVKRAKFPMMQGSWLRDAVVENISFLAFSWYEVFMPEL